MPNPKSPESYPTIYQDLVQAITETGQVATVHVEDKKAALRLRARFHAWRTALVGHEEMADVLAAAQSVQVVLAGIGPNSDFLVSFCPTEQSPETSAISRAIEDLKKGLDK